VEKKVAIEISKDPEVFSDFEHQGWETSSGGYDRHWARLTRQTLSATLDAAGVVEGSRVLDVCCGPGMLSAAVLSRGARAVGLDFSNKFIEIARRNVPGADFRQGDAQSLPYDEDSFDAVVCGYGVIHVPSPDVALREMCRVLRPGGRLAISVWGAPEPDNGFGILYGAFKSHGNLDVPLPHGPDFFQFSDPKRMTDTLKAIGLRHITAQSVDQSWHFDEPLGIIQAVLEGAVRARALLLAQTDSAREEIENSIIKGMSRCSSDDGGYDVPMPAIVGAGVL
jgi:SAM-dependent methyltransferase